MTYKNYILMLNESRPDIDVFLRYCEDPYSDEFYDEDEDEFKDIDIFEYSAADYLWAASNERELVEVAEAITDNWRDFSKEHSSWDYCRYDIEDLSILIFKTHSLTDGENISMVMDAYGYIIDKNNKWLAPRVLKELPESYITLELMKELIEHFYIEDFIADKIKDGLTFLGELLLTGDIEDDMKEWKNDEYMVGIILKDKLKEMKDWDLFYEYSVYIGGLIGSERLQYALNKGTYKLDKDRFIYFLENLVQGKNSGHPFRNYGEAAAQEVLEDYEWEDTELNELINDSYILSKIDWEMPYDMINKDANRREAEHIDSMGPNYRHN